jgi:hypothetical protein
LTTILRPFRAIDHSVVPPPAYAGGYSYLATFVAKIFLTKLLVQSNESTHNYSRGEELLKNQNILLLSISYLLSNLLKKKLPLMRQLLVINVLYNIQITPA